MAINNSPLQDIPELKTTLDAYNAVTAAMNITSLAGAIGKGTIAKFFKELDNPAAKKALLAQAKNGSDDAKKVLDVEAELKAYSEAKLGKDWWKGAGRFIAKTGTELRTHLSTIITKPAGVPYNGNMYRYIPAKHADNAANAKAIIQTASSDIDNRFRR
ncbi:hypothetical protein [Niabella ginsengisoli]|uniref:HK97 gp10 family phage protein n=1 Tax=Niabella ginsengisoli TaxID=522298 RepID=A0ABS9SHY4_9BACT|nr:hypothetical protein [Niabella ginsengisoli]MCH5597976.1 hypothetical protein [Niabella ginsengisoli]